MHIKRDLAVSLFFTVTLLFLLHTFVPTRHFKSTAAYHNFINSQEYQNKPREAQLKKCAECHRREYENELAGPHANAYKNLMAHKDYVNSNKYDCALYKNRVNNNIEACSGCHSTQNLFDGSLKDYSNMDSLTARVMTHPNPDARPDMASRVSGVDCYTCHFDGIDFISLASFNNPDQAKDPHQSKATLAKNNMTCYPCHFDVVDSFQASIAITRTGSMLCVNCHVETDLKGAKTHYYYWKKEGPDKKNPLITSLLKDFSFAWAADKKTLNITWDNKSMPHMLPIATELIFDVDLLDKDSSILAHKQIRVNRKKQYDKDSYEDLGNNYLGGIVGDDLPLYRAAHYSMPYRQNKKPATIRISYIDKAQFWLSDSSIGRVLQTRLATVPE